MHKLEVLWVEGTNGLYKSFPKGGLQFTDMLGKDINGLQSILSEEILPSAPSSSSHGLEGENVSNKLWLAYISEYVLCLYDSLCQSQLVPRCKLEKSVLKQQLLFMPDQYNKFSLPPSLAISLSPSLLLLLCPLLLSFLLSFLPLSLLLFPTPIFLHHSLPEIQPGEQIYFSHSLYNRDW